MGTVLKAQSNLKTKLATENTEVTEETSGES